MPGFVDVTGMTYEDVRRMGHADDYDEEPQHYSRRASSYNKPAVQVGYAVNDVWAAACAAQRINDGYFKEHVYEHLEHQALVEPPALVKRKNRDVMMEFLANPSQLTVDDVERGEHCRQFLQNDLTFRTLKNKIGEFDTAIKKVLAVLRREEPGVAWPAASTIGGILDGRGLVRRRRRHHHPAVVRQGPLFGHDGRCRQGH